MGRGAARRFAAGPDLRGLDCAARRTATGRRGACRKRWTPALQRSSGDSARIQAQLAMGQTPPADAGASARARPSGNSAGSAPRRRQHGQRHQRDELPPDQRRVVARDSGRRRLGPFGDDQRARRIGRPGEQTLQRSACRTGPPESITRCRSRGKRSKRRRRKGLYCSRRRAAERNERVDFSRSSGGTFDIASGAEKYAE